MYTVLADAKIRDNFKLSEVKCKCGRNHALYTDEVADLIQRIRDKIGKPVHVHSWYRCPEHNKNVGGSPKSQHLQGNAVDFHVNGVSPDQLAKIAKECGAKGIGVYHWGIHVDMRKEPKYWDMR